MRDESDSARRVEREISRLRKNIAMWAEIAEASREKERRYTIYLTVLAMFGSALISVFLAETLRAGLYSVQFYLLIIFSLIFSFIVLGFRSRA